MARITGITVLKGPIGLRHARRNGDTAGPSRGRRVETVATLTGGAQGAEQSMMERRQ